MDQSTSLLDSHGITHQLQVQLWKLPITSKPSRTEGQSEKTTLQLKLNRNKHLSDNEHLISNGITRNILIHIVREEVTHQLLNKLDSGNPRKPSCTKRADSKRRVYNCPICPRHVELSPRFIRNHVAAHHSSEKLLNCSIPKCEFSTWVPHFLKTHLSRVHQQRPFQCTLCPKKFKNPPHLQVHMLIHTAAECKKYICPRSNCEYATHHAGNLRSHLQSHSLELKFKCRHCGWRSKYDRSIASHVKTIHGADRNISKPFKCPHDQCNFTSSKSAAIRVHSVVHSDQKPFQCQLCKFSTKYAKSLRNHLMVHSGLKPYQCNLCGKKMRTTQHLNDHLRRHLGEKPFQCSESNCCSFVAASRSEIKLHVNHHHLKGGGLKVKGF